MGSYPMVGDSVVIELSIVPDTAASTPAIRKTCKNIRPTGTPMSCAAAPFWAVALIARPMRVRLRMSATTIMIRMDARKITTL